MDEFELIKNAQRGDVPSFNRLVLVYQELVYNVCLRILGKPEAAADATQDGFLSAFQSIKQFRGGSFKAWLLRIAVNGCYDQLRRQRRRTTAPLEDVIDDPNYTPSLVEPAPGPEEQALRREFVEYLQKGLVTLPVEQRVVVVLSDVHGFSYEEIAEATATSLGTVKSRLSRARAKLRDFLLQERELLPVHLRLVK